MSFCWVFAAFSPGEVLLEPRSLLLMSRDAYELYVHRIDHVEVHIQDSQWKIPIKKRLATWTGGHHEARDTQLRILVE